MRITQIIRKIDFGFRSRPLLTLLCLTATVAFTPGCGSDNGTVSPPVGPTPYQPTIPENFPDFREPADNPTTVEGVALGRRLFYDTILSRNQQQSCASCHQPGLAFADDRRFSLGTDGVSEGNRNAPSLFNMVWTNTFFWDGRADGLEGQARGPVPNPIEMDLSWNEAVARVQAHSRYPALFEAAFGKGDITEDRIVQAIAQFERTLISANSKFDKSIRGEVTLSDQEKEGERLFFNERGDCFHCHGNILFTTLRFTDIGLDEVPADSGLIAVTGNPSDYGKFKIPSLRNIEYTAPYMHDGRFQTLREVINHYDGDIEFSPNLDPLLLVHRDRGPILNEEERDALEAFLKTLSDPDYLTNPDYQSPFP